MTANLSRNGPALQDAYGRVVTEKSPTDWWAPRGWGGAGPGSQGAPSRAAAGRPGLTWGPTPAPHPGGLSQPLPRRAEPGRSACLGPGPPCRAASSAALGGLAGSCFAARDLGLPEKAEATPGFVQTLCPGRTSARRAARPRGVRQGGRGLGSLLFCACEFQNLPFSKNAPSCAGAVRT